MQCLHVESVSFTTFATDNNGPIVRLWCRSDFNGMHFVTRYPTLTWTYGEKILAANSTLIEADSSRFVSAANYELRYMHSRRTFELGVESVLKISNAVKDDEGVYMCQEQYNENVTDSRNVSVTITEYLPPLHHPLCLLEPSNMLQDGSDVTFHCLVGDSNPAVKLRLTLEKPDGSSTPIGQLFFTGNASVVKTITTDDNNATFVCLMISDTFPTGSRNCSAGPIMLMSASTESSHSTMISVTSMDVSISESASTAITPTLTPTTLSLIQGLIALWIVKDHYFLSTYINTDNSFGCVKID